MQEADIEQTPEGQAPVDGGWFFSTWVRWRARPSRASGSGAVSMGASRIRPRLASESTSVRRGSVGLALAMGTRGFDGKDEDEAMDINSGAPVITRDEILISAPIQTIWDIQTDVADWPSWQPDVDGAVADGPLTPGAVFRWQTAGLDITSTVEEVDAPRRIVWGGPAQGIAAVHVWTFEEQDGAVLVRTAESWEGDPVAAQPEALQAALDASLRAWLENLKRTAEGRSGG